MKKPKFDLDEALDVIKAPKEIKEEAKKTGLPFFALRCYHEQQRLQAIKDEEKAQLKRKK